MVNYDICLMMYFYTGIIAVLRTRTARARIKTKIRRARTRIGIDTVVP